MFHKSNGKAQRREVEKRGPEKGVSRQAQKPSTPSIRRGMRYEDVLMDAAKEPGKSCVHTRPNCVLLGEVMENKV